MVFTGAVCGACERRCRASPGPGPGGLHNAAMPKPISLLSVTLALLTAPLALLAQDAQPGVRFQHKDWELACDNTGHCTAAGYQRDGDRPVSVKLERAPGPNTPIKAQLQLGTDPDTPEADRQLPPGTRLVLTIGERRVGRAIGPFGGESPVLDLPAEQAQAVLAALRGTDEIVWRAGPARVWTLSGDGANAVLLKMDEAQGRLGTPGALRRKGTRPEAQVPGPRPLPVVQEVMVQAPTPADLALASEPPQDLLAALRGALGPEDDCERLEPGAEEAPKLSVDRLGPRLLRVSTLCWVAAYNAGAGVWELSDGPPWRARLVTTMASDLTPTGINMSQKGRGMGDCFATQDWVWDGQRHRATQIGDSGMCKFFFGGSWPMVTLRSQVVSPPAR
jgi:hypothetical protein